MEGFSCPLRSKCCFRGFYTLTGIQWRGKTEALALIWVLKSPYVLSPARNSCTEGGNGRNIKAAEEEEMKEQEIQRKEEMKEGGNVTRRNREESSNTTARLIQIQQEGRGETEGCREHRGGNGKRRREKTGAQPGEVHLLRGGQKLTERMEQRAEGWVEEETTERWQQVRNSQKKKRSKWRRETAGGEETDRRRQRKKTEIQIFWWSCSWMVHEGSTAGLL